MATEIIYEPDAEWKADSCVA